MKDKKILIISTMLIILFLIASFVLYKIYNQKIPCKNEINSKVLNKETKILEKKLSTKKTEKYETDLYSVLIPDGWYSIKVDDENTVITEKEQATDKSIVPYINIFHTKNETKMSLEDYVKSNIDNLKDTKSDLDEVFEGSEKIIIQKSKGYLIKSHIKYQEDTINRFSFITMKNNQIYTVTFQSLEKDYNNYLDTAMMIMQNYILK